MVFQMILLLLSLLATPVLSCLGGTGGSCCPQGYPAQTCGSAPPCPPQRTYYQNPSYGSLSNYATQKEAVPYNSAQAGQVPAVNSLYGQNPQPYYQGIGAVDQQLPLADTKVERNFDTNPQFTVPQVPNQGDTVVVPQSSSSDFIAAPAQPSAISASSPFVEAPQNIESAVRSSDTISPKRLRYFMRHN